ncbi:hypothetical protein AWB67_04944 [Caballeronia terrestris]|uniref:Uncharacterized protein n=1 Tax=Caballeronia terrestris TaxID=1226301 RepID=A0A158K755_9BURK|nr:hypothetical protein [Caballeronia terrestris]SAL76563.1 hypothetical protein AWB67_04944 [Caballeronia terrestris]
MNLKHQNQQTTRQQPTIQRSTLAPVVKASYAFHRADDQFDSAVTYSCFKDRTSMVPQRITESFQELAMRCRTPESRSRNDGPTFSPFTFSLLHDGYNARECNFLSFKFEKMWAFTQSEDILACVDGLASFVYSTHSHTVKPRPTGSYQLIVALSTPIPEEYYKVVAMNFATRFSRLRGIINSSYMSPDQRLQFPSCPISRQRFFSMEAQCGRSFDWSPDFTENQAPKAHQSWGMQ